MERVSRKKHSIIVRLDDSGKVLETLQDTTGKFHALSEVAEHNGHLFIGSPKNDFIVQLKLEQ